MEVPKQPLSTLPYNEKTTDESILTREINIYTKKVLHFIYEYFVHLQFGKN